MSQAWTKEPPTEDGYYWARREGADEPEVVKIEGGKVVTRTLYNEPMTVPLNKTIYRAAEWLGPIAPLAKDKVKK